MDAPQSLCPGYKQVDAFGPDDDYEDEEEVVYVTLDMGNVEPTLVPSSTSYRLIGLDTPTPFLQLQGTVLKGRHDLLLGTELIFTDDKESHDWNKRSVVHVANTEQRIAFQEVTLIPKGSSSNSTTISAPAISSNKGKQKATEKENGAASGSGEFKVNFEPPAPSVEELSAQIDRLSGLTGPIPRASRSRKSSTAPRSQPVRKGTDKGKEKERTRSTRASTRAKAKQRKKQKDRPSPVLGKISQWETVRLPLRILFLQRMTTCM
ncbi:hypothetical protein CPB84DRAFT_1685364 [Gymnopilus junonius]|uniref:Transcription factor TFIIIC triple barrel domain-containing protein n=1 Tax=Gymnopilus junonius TaxID=109634 RepID=A0A9P5NFN4_GYMJU|nr:hypothetical protein CPB84DRAFT_1685364 [Gymnopilus junonius]